MQEHLPNKSDTVLHLTDHFLYAYNYVSKNNGPVEILDIDEFNNPQMQLLNNKSKDNEDGFIEPIDAEEMIMIETQINKTESEEEVKPLSIFSDIPDFEMVNTELEDNRIKEDVKVPSYSSEPPPLYKLCDSCGMQINYNDNICPVCGKQL